jgi:hypothetical protein
VRDEELPCMREPRKCRNGLHAAAESFSMDAPIVQAVSLVEMAGGAGLVENLRAYSFVFVADPIVKSI